MKYNRGEWTEYYVFLKLLADGVMFAQNIDGSKSETTSNIAAIIKESETGVLEFSRNEDHVSCHLNGDLFSKISVNEFKSMGDSCIQQIKSRKDTTFEIPDVEDFFCNRLNIKNMKSKSSSKDDITLKIKSMFDGSYFMEGFSVKSKFGSPATLFNFSKASNIVYMIKNCGENEMKKINSMMIDKTSKDISARVDYILKSKKLLLQVQNSRVVSGSYGDLKISGNYFAWNLDLIDYRILFVLAEMLKKHFVPNGIADISQMIEILSEENPLQVRFPKDFYKMKMRQFLFACFCGMTASKKWSGRQQVNGGYIEVQKDGELLYQRALSDENFTDYLLANTRIESPSSKANKGDFGDVYFSEEYNSYCIDLNFQVRFKR